MPDYLKGGLPANVFPVDTEEKQKMVADFFAEDGLGNFEKGSKKIDASAKEIRKIYRSVEQISGIGLCWGGKVRTEFSIIATATKCSRSGAHTRRQHSWHTVC